VKAALLPPNKNELEDFEAWGAALPRMTNEPSYSMTFNMRGRRDSSQRNRRILTLRNSPGDVLQVLARRPEAYREGMSEFCGRFLGPAGDELFNCGAGQGGCIDAYGRYQLCLLLRHPDTVYDLVGGDAACLREALTEFVPSQRQRLAQNPDYQARCAGCFLKGLCEQCPARSWMEHGTLDTPVEYLCQVAHAQARYLGLLGEHENAWDVEDWQDRVARLQEQPTGAAGSPEPTVERAGMLEDEGK
jgi:radical SAM protein with 4Fe4S-binding SPASM domain